MAMNELDGTLMAVKQIRLTHQLSKDAEAEVCYND